MTATLVAAHMECMETLTENPAVQAVTTRLATAMDPASDNRTLWQLIDDPHNTVANTARTRLGLAARPIGEHHAGQAPVR